ncbi:unnamed protein product, partial [marine sediment metagenome]
VEPLVAPENDKPTVIALREIAEDLIEVDEYCNIHTKDEAQKEE